MQKIRKTILKMSNKHTKLRPPITNMVDSQNLQTEYSVRLQKSLKLKINHFSNSNLETNILE